MAPVLLESRCSKGRREQDGDVQPEVWGTKSKANGANDDGMSVTAYAPTADILVQLCQHG